MRDDEVIQIAHMRHQSEAALTHFANEINPTVDSLQESFKHIEDMFSSNVLSEFINQIGPEIMAMIIKHTGTFEEMYAIKDTPAEETWIAGLINVGMHMFYLGMHSERIKQEEKEELSKEFKKLMSALNTEGDEDARKETEN